MRDVVYTAIMGGYERLGEIDPRARSVDCEYICFTDDQRLTSDTWRIEVIDPPVPGDPIRSARSVKLLGHPVLERFDRTLWVDNRVELLCEPGELLDEWLSDADLAIPLHSYRAAVADEFRAVLHSGLDSTAILRAQYARYRNARPEVLASRPLWTALIARRSTAGTRLFAQTWHSEVMHFSRRDQLSVRYALAVTSPEMTAVPISNLGSHWHRWRNESETGRKPATQVSSRPKSTVEVLDRLDSKRWGRAITVAAGALRLYDRMSVPPADPNVFGMFYNPVTVSEASVEVLRLASTSNSHLIVTPNSDHFLRWRREDRFREAYAASSMVVLDGQPLVWIARICGYAAERVTGVDLLGAVMKRLNDASMKIFFVGVGIGNSTAVIENALRKRYGGDLAATFLNPSAAQLGDADYLKALANELREFERKIVVLGIGSPRQEYLAQELIGLGSGPGAYLGLGAAVGFVSGIDARAPEYIQRLGFEWLYRLAREPRRLWRRYVIVDSKIGLYVIRALGRRLARVVGSV